MPGESAEKETAQADQEHFDAVFAEMDLGDLRVVAVIWPDDGPPDVVWSGCSSVYEAESLLRNGAKKLAREYAFPSEGDDDEDEEDDY